MKPQRRVRPFRLADMEPLVPIRFDAGLTRLGSKLISEAGRLGADLHPATREWLAELISVTEAYYSLELSENGAAHDGAKLATGPGFAAQLRLQATLEKRRHELPGNYFCSSPFLAWLNSGLEFHRRKVWRMRGARRRFSRPKPGEFRSTNIHHTHELAPHWRKIRPFLKRYAQFFGPLVAEGPHSVVAAAAAHQRLLWLRPFRDGNGRVARLAAHAWLAAAGAGGSGLWSLSRALARQKAAYLRALDHADTPRRNRFDGRGRMSERYLADFCQFFLRAALDEIEFMRELLGADAVLDRITAFGTRGESAGRLPHGATALLRELFLRGELARGEVPAIIGTSPRTAQKVTGELLLQRVVVSESPKGFLRLGLGADLVRHYFPGLGPVGLDGFTRP